MRRDLAEDLVEGNLTLPAVQRGSGFIEDLRTARGVIAGGGFTLMGEAVYLRKPMLAVPVAEQFEQILNARYLERLGYGDYAPAVTAGRPGRLPGAPAGPRARPGRLPPGRQRRAAGRPRPPPRGRAVAVSGTWTLDEAFR